ncbi:conserved hypothetical protein [uncultured delta proteobacterium]|uniref:MobA-like NTP transferase domain-containing protein n=1 Tax=uncultured delta proteobacterium TaxID=34034 RepID=A0A212JBQ6_9DELT|nr:conserved hypothetical protein [uncultured delta proteobacterium]
MPQTDSGIAAVMLAAGGGSRLGGGKLLLPWRGQPLFAHVLRTVAQAHGLLSLTVVLGHDAEAVRRAVADAVPDFAVPVHVTVNRDWREGQSASLRCGLAHARSAPGGDAVRGVLFLLGDQPLVTTGTLDALIRAHGAACAKNPAHPATVPVYQGTRGNPVILSHRLFPDLMALRGDTGARHILRELDAEILRVPVDDPGILHDVDTPEAYAALCAPRGDLL